LRKDVFRDVFVILIYLRIKLFGKIMERKKWHLGFRWRWRMNSCECYVRNKNLIIFEFRILCLRSHAPPTILWCRLSFLMPCPASKPNFAPFVVSFYGFVCVAPALLIKDVSVYGVVHRYNIDTCNYI